jgi:hypothetical protein
VNDATESVTLSPWLQIPYVGVYPAQRHKPPFRDRQKPTVHLGEISGAGWAANLVPDTAWRKTAHLCRTRRFAIKILIVLRRLLRVRYRLRVTVIMHISFEQ